VEGGEIVCPRHGARFSIVTGAALSPPAYEPVASFPVRVDDGIVKVGSACHGLVVTSVLSGRVARLTGVRHAGQVRARCGWRVANGAAIGV